MGLSTRVQVTVMHLVALLGSSTASSTTVNFFSMGNDCHSDFSSCAIIMCMHDLTVNSCGQICIHRSTHKHLTTNLHTAHALHTHTYCECTCIYLYVGLLILISVFPRLMCVCVFVCVHTCIRILLAWHAC